MINPKRPTELTQELKDKGWTYGIDGDFHDTTKYAAKIQSIKNQDSSTSSKMKP